MKTALKIPTTKFLLNSLFCNTAMRVLMSLRHFSEVKGKQQCGKLHIYKRWRQLNTFTALSIKKYFSALMCTNKNSFLHFSRYFFLFTVIFSPIDAFGRNTQRWNERRIVQELCTCCYITRPWSIRMEKELFDKKWFVTR